MRFTPGAAWLCLNQKYGHGLKAAWYRDVIRPRILVTPPVRGNTDDSCEIHVLTSKHDWLNLVWTLKSFYGASRRKFALCIHEDGSLTENQVDIISDHFPNARVIRRTAADARIFGELSKHPRTLSFRRTNLLAPKITDFLAFLESDRMALFDSDLLFFRSPKAYLERVDDACYPYNTFNADFGHAYTVKSEDVETLIGHKVVSRINSGFGLVHRASIRWDWIEEFLALPAILEGHFWRIEQTLFALCSSRYGVELLPEEYTLRLEPGIGGRPFRHYVGAIRHLMYKEGIAHLVSGGFLKAGVLQNETSGLGEGVHA